MKVSTNANAEYIYLQGKTFKVHKAFFCSRSSVLRAMIQSNMKEGITAEINLEKDEMVDEKTLTSMIHYIYTGEMSGEDLEIQKVVHVCDKYDLPGLLDLFALELRTGEVKPEQVADMIIAARRHEEVAGELWDIAREKIREEREILRDERFREAIGSEGNPEDILYKIMEDL